MNHCSRNEGNSEGINEGRRHGQRNEVVDVDEHGEICISLENTSILS